MFLSSDSACRGTSLQLKWRTWQKWQGWHTNRWGIEECCWFTSTAKLNVLNTFWSVGFPCLKVKTWFQNRRMKLRRHQKDTSWVSERYTTNKGSPVCGTVFKIPSHVPSVSTSHYTTLFVSGVVYMGKLYFYFFGQNCIIVHLNM